MTYTLILLRHGQERVERKEPVHRLVRRHVSPSRPCRSHPRRRAADRRRCAARRGPHLGDEAGRSHPANLALDAADLRWIPVNRSLAAQRTSLRCPPGQGQGADPAPSTAKSSSWLASLVRHPAAPMADDAEFARPVTLGTRSCGDDCPRTSTSRTSSSACSRTGKTRSSRSWPRARPFWSSRTATRCGPWSSTWTESATRTSPGSTSPRASRSCTN